jgi:aerobic-type carbon monoxide dehydrogenase small subunit (CoxS/CutS family)
MSAKALLDENPSANKEEIKDGIAGNICRCTGYIQIIDAIHSVSSTGAETVNVVAWQSETEKS